MNNQYKTPGTSRVISSATISILATDEGQLGSYIRALLKHASPGVHVALRAYTDDGSNKAISTGATQVATSGVEAIVRDAIAVAGKAARHKAPAVFCPPLAGFSSPTSAAEADLIEAYTITVDCDDHPVDARTSLESCLGRATVAVETGGDWINRETGEVEKKVHLHWRLTEPATRDSMALLKKVRRVATEKVGGDLSGISPVHCFRAPGSWHRKGEPKLAQIVTLNPDIELELGNALERLKEMQAAPWVSAKALPGGDHAAQGGDDRELADLFEGIQTGTSYHANLVALSARSIGSGMYPGAVVNYLRGLMEASVGTHDDRWAARFNDIPRIVESAQTKFGEQWPEPKPLPTSLPPVAAFASELVPMALRPWIMDISERMQCPPDYVAVSAIVAAGSVIGRRIGIRAQEYTDWTEVPNVWGMIVGRPGVMKTPAMSHALKPLKRLDAIAAEANRELKAEYEQALEHFKSEQSASRKKSGGGTEQRPEKPEKPEYKRYLVNDTTYEALGEVMADNPKGVMAFRDELVSLLRPLDREENAAARGFYLSAWNGTEGYTFDRIIRGHMHIEACCLSLLGATQPAKLAAYLNDAVQGGIGDDGFAQRFGLLVWPDIPPNWRDVDREPDAEARRRAMLVFDRLDRLEPGAVGARKDEHDPIPYLRFDPEALVAFRSWRDKLERRLRGSELHDAMVSHLNKYRGLIPKLALVFHLVEGAAGPVSLSAVTTALAWADYLETHAHRAYASVTSVTTAGAGTILAKIKAGALPDAFTARDVYEKNWSGLGDAKRAGEALSILVDYDWLALKAVKTDGRPKSVYMVNPKASAR